MLVHHFLEFPFTELLFGQLKVLGEAGSLFSYRFLFLFPWGILIWSLLEAATLFCPRTQAHVDIVLFFFGRSKKRILLWRKKFVQPPRNDYPLLSISISISSVARSSRCHCKSFIPAHHRTKLHYLVKSIGVFAPPGLSSPRVKLNLISVLLLFRSLAFFRVSGETLQTKRARAVLVLVPLADAGEGFTEHIQASSSD